MSSNLVPFFGGRRDLSRNEPNQFEALDHQTCLRAAQIKSQAELEMFEDYTQATLADQAMNHTASLVNRAKEHIQTTPEAARYLEPIIANYAQAAANRVSGRRFK